MNKLVGFGAVGLGAVLITNVLAQRAAALNYGEKVKIVLIRMEESNTEGSADYVTLITENNATLLPEQVSCEADQMALLDDYLGDDLRAGDTPVNPAIVCEFIPAG